MNLTDVQKQKVVQWIQEGLKLSEIQNKLGSELEIRMTYMEVKMLMADLDLKPKDQERPKPPAALTAPPDAAPQAAAASPLTTTPIAGEPGLDDPMAGDGGTPPPLGASSVAVTVDTVTRPGSVVSGKVTFSDQKTAEWYLDQYGRLGFAPTEKGYRPSQMDLMAFQTELQNQLARFGY